MPNVLARRSFFGAIAFFIFTLALPDAFGASEATGCPDLTLTEVAPGAWVHTSWNTLTDETCIPSNGMVFVGADRVLLVDTAWTKEDTEELIEKLKPLRAPENPLAGPKIMNFLITHAHVDRMGGISVTTSKGIPSFAFPGTVERAAQNNLGSIAFALPQDSFSFDLGGRVVEAFFPGPGHTADNVVVYDRGEKVLFGGCFIRASNAADLGNTEDALPLHWDDSLLNTMERYLALKIVVPGHGESGGRELIQHTRDLVNEHNANHH